MKEHDGIVMGVVIGLLVAILIQVFLLRVELKQFSRIDICKEVPE